MAQTQERWDKSSIILIELKKVKLYPCKPNFSVLIDRNVCPYPYPSQLFFLLYDPYGQTRSYVSGLPFHTKHPPKWNENEKERKKSLIHKAILLSLKLPNPSHKVVKKTKV